MNKKEMKNLSLRVEAEKWELFKKLARANESDSSKELRKFINRYIEENKELVNKLF